jgi:hypothetical protein
VIFVSVIVRSSFLIPRCCPSKIYRDEVALIDLMVTPSINSFRGTDNNNIQDMYEILIYEIQSAMNPRYKVVSMHRCLVASSMSLTQLDQYVLGIKQDKLVAHFHLAISDQETVIRSQVPNSSTSFHTFPSSSPFPPQNDKILRPLLI